MLDMFNYFINNKNTPKGPVEYIIAGLGNPGDKYKNTRHNAGFMAVDYIAEKCYVDIDKPKFKSLIKDTANSSTCFLLQRYFL